MSRRLTWFNLVLQSSLRLLCGEQTRELQEVKVEKPVRRLWQLRGLPGLDNDGDSGRSEKWSNVGSALKAELPWFIEEWPLEMRKKRRWSWIAPRVWSEQLDV